MEPSVSITSALSVPLRSTAQARALLDGVGALARRRASIELDLADVLAWLRRRDPVELGVVTWTAFCGERVDWRGSWLRDMVRLAESPLAKVRAAAAEGLVPLRTAVKAPGRVAEHEQDAWLADAVLGPADEDEPRDFDVYAGEEAECIRRARDLARLLMGRAAPTREVDAYILGAWRDRVPAEALLAEARVPPPAPEPGPPPPWHGRGAEPRTPREALDRLDALQATLRGITPVLARAWARVSEEYLWVEAGFDRAEDCARELLGMSLRNAQRLARFGRGLERYPEIAHAIERGLSPRTAERLIDLTPDDDAAAWLALAERVGRREHHRAIDDARRVASGRPTLARYQAAIDLADRWTATPEGAAALQTEATPAGGPAPRLLVALRHPEAATFSRAPLRAPPGILPAARWFLATVDVPPARGFARVKQRDGYRCTNPACGRRSLRTEAHHLHARSLGGSDEAWNGVGACRMCHLRGIHAGRLSARRVVVEGHDAVLWTWPDGRRVLQLRDEPGRPGVFGGS